MNVHILVNAKKGLLSINIKCAYYNHKEGLKCIQIIICMTNIIDLTTIIIEAVSKLTCIMMKLLH